MSTKQIDEPNIIPELPTNYEAPSDIIDVIYKKRAAKLDSEKWGDLSGLDYFYGKKDDDKEMDEYMSEKLGDLSGLNNSDDYKVDKEKYEYWKEKISEMAWKHGDRTPQGAFDWLGENWHTIMPIEDHSATMAYGPVQSFLYANCKDDIKRRFQRCLRSYLNTIAKNSSSKVEALQNVGVVQIEHLPFQEDFEEFIKSESTKYLNSI